MSGWVQERQQITGREVLSGDIPRSFPIAPFASTTLASLGWALLRHRAFCVCFTMRSCFSRLPGDFHAFALSVTDDAR